MTKRKSTEKKRAPAAGAQKKGGKGAKQGRTSVSEKRSGSGTKGAKKGVKARKEREAQFRTMAGRTVFKGWRSQELKLKAFSLYCKGLPVESIAVRCGISVHTVMSWRTSYEWKRIFRKLYGLNAKSAVIAMSVNLGLNQDYARELNESK